jgi:L-ascorbate metabolism protein UlaG (beta-lactamase superfamily)
VRLRLIRHATLLLRDARHCLLVDPMLDPAGERPPVPNTPNDRRNPLVDLPEPAEVVVHGVSGVVVTHLHQDHLDATAVRLLPEDVPVFCAPGDADALRGHGFADVRAVEDRREADGVPIVRTAGVHGELGPTAGFVIDRLYVAGDTIWGDEVRAALDEHRPEVVVVNAGGARFTGGDPIVMTVDDVVAVARHAPQAHVIAVHLEAINHCLETRGELRRRVHEEGLTGRVTVPEDGAEVPLRAT